MTKYPKYYEVNDTKVVVKYDEKTDEVYAETKSGSPFSLGKILQEGGEISEKEFKAS